MLHPSLHLLPHAPLSPLPSLRVHQGLEAGYVDHHQALDTPSDNVATTLLLDERPTGYLGTCQ